MPHHAKRHWVWPVYQVQMCGSFPSRGLRLQLVSRPDPIARQGRCSQQGTVELNVQPKQRHTCVCVCMCVQVRDGVVIPGSGLNAHRIPHIALIHLASSALLNQEVLPSFFRIPCLATCDDRRLTVSAWTPAASNGLAPHPHPISSNAHHGPAANG